MLNEKSPAVLRPLLQPNHANRLLRQRCPGRGSVCKKDWLCLQFRQMFAKLAAFPEIIFVHFAVV
jgi:hypothetical protein